jgi:hypothetical protein
MIDAATVWPINIRWKSVVYRGLSNGPLVGREAVRSKSALRSAIFLMVLADLNQRSEADFWSRARLGTEGCPVKTPPGQPNDPVGVPVRCYRRL